YPTATSTRRSRASHTQGCAPPPQRLGNLESLMFSSVSAAHLATNRRDPDPPTQNRLRSPPRTSRFATIASCPARHHALLCPCLFPPYPYTATKTLLSVSLALTSAWCRHRPDRGLPTVIAAAAGTRPRHMGFLPSPPPLHCQRPQRHP